MDRKIERVEDFLAWQKARPAKIDRVTGGGLRASVERKRDLA
jgi:hypothetical protein